jgi:hypothetical protein
MNEAITCKPGVRRYQPSAAVMKRLPSKWPKPVWHPPWVNYRVCVELEYSFLVNDYSMVKKE